MANPEDLPLQAFVADGADDLDEEDREYFEKGRLVIANVVRRIEEDFNMNDLFIEQNFRFAQAIHEKVELFLVLGRGSLVDQFMQLFRDAVTLLRDNIAQFPYPRRRG